MLTSIIKYLPVVFVLFSFFKMKAQNDTLMPWELQLTMGSALPLEINNMNGADLDLGTNTEFSINYHFSDQYFASVKFSSAKHEFSDQYSLNAYPKVRTHYIIPMIGKSQTIGKFHLEEKIGFGMFYARIPAYLSQKIGEYYFGKSADESHTFIGEFNFLTAYNFTERFSVIMNVALKYSEINWNIRYNGFVETDLGLDYILTDSYEQRVNYFPVAMSLGVAYHLYKKPPVGSFVYNLLDTPL